MTTKMVQISQSMIFAICLIFTFNNKYYKHVDGVDMGFPLGPALANILMCRFASKWPRDYPNDFKPVL